MLAAEELAASAIPDRFDACDPTQTAECVASEYVGALSTLYRRALTDAEIETAATMIADQIAEGATAQNASRAMLAAALISPDFLFRSPPSAVGDAPEQRRVADQLSFTLWDAPPDEELLDATPSVGQSGLQGEALRLLRDERATRGIARFLAQWLDVDTDLRLENESFGDSAAYLEWLDLTAHNIDSDVPI